MQKRLPRQHKFLLTKAWRSIFYFVKFKRESFDQRMYRYNEGKKVKESSDKILMDQIHLEFGPKEEGTDEDISLTESQKKSRKKWTSNQPKIP